MRIKRYVAATMEEALQRVKAELGSGAIILEVRRRRRALGVFGGGGVEVVAAVDPGLRLVSDRLPAGGTEGLGWSGGGGAGRSPAPAPAPADAPVPAPAPAPGPRPAAVRAYHRAAESAGASPGPEAAERRDGQAAPAVPPRRGVPRGEAGELAALLRCDLMPQTAERLLEGGVRIDDPTFAGRLEQLAAERLGEAPATPARTIAFVGPTGAGKTTSLAKVAARAVLMEGRRVELITLDTYRVGAVDQLQTYAEILDVPLYVAYTAEDLSAAMERAAAADLVLIDTAGRGPGDAVGIARLRRALAQIQIDETHLVMAAGTRVLDAQYLAATYGRLGPNRLLLTKLDETLALGGILELPALLGLPASYFSFGQSVPDDIEVATPRGAAARLLEALRHAGEGAGA